MCLAHRYVTEGTLLKVSGWCSFVSVQIQNNIRQSTSRRQRLIEYVATKMEELRFTGCNNMSIVSRNIDDKNETFSI